MVSCERLELGAAIGFRGLTFSSVMQRETELIGR